MNDAVRSLLTDWPWYLGAAALVALVILGPRLVDWIAGQL